MAIEQQDTGRDSGTSTEPRRTPEDARSTPLVTPPPRPRPDAERRRPARPESDRSPEDRSGPVEAVERVAVTVEHPGEERESDVLLDIPRLEVDELGLELEAGALLRHVRLDVKDLHLGLLLRADLERLAELKSGRREDASAGRGPGGRLAHVAYGRLFGSGERERPELGAGSDQPPAERDDEQHDDRSAQAEETGRGSRVGRVAKEGGKAAAVAAAGLAGGALVESRLKPLRKLGVELPSPLRRRESAPRAALRRVTQALPG